MYRYPFILLIVLAIVNNLYGQTIVKNSFTASKLSAHFDEVNDAIPRMSDVYREGSLVITALQNSDSAATFQIEEKGINPDFFVDNEKELNRLLSPANKETHKPTIYILASATLKDKSTAITPPKKEFLFYEYSVIWDLTIKKTGEKQTELSLTYKSLAPDFAKKIDHEFKRDIYYSNVIKKIVADEKKMQQTIEDLLTNKLHVDRDPVPPMAPSRSR